MFGYDCTSYPDMDKYFSPTVTKAFFRVMLEIGLLLYNKFKLRLFDCFISRRYGGVDRWSVFETVAYLRFP